MSSVGGAAIGPYHGGQPRERALIGRRVPLMSRHAYSTQTYLASQANYLRPLQVPNEVVRIACYALHHVGTIVVARKEDAKALA